MRKPVWSTESAGRVPVRPMRWMANAVSAANKPEAMRTATQASNVSRSIRLGTTSNTTREFDA